LKIVSRMLSHKILIILSGLTIPKTAVQNAWGVPVSAVPPNAVHGAEMNPVMIAIEAAVMLAAIALVASKRRRSERRPSVKR
jgi:hypothetical protein